jgi:hypothetical protein
MARFDLRHKETLRLFLREYFELFFPLLAAKMDFETVRFLDKELIALFSDPEGQRADPAGADIQRVTDALVLVELELDGRRESMLIYWEHQSRKVADYVGRMFHCFCGIYFRYERAVFPIAMFTDPAVWREPVPDRLTMSVGGYPIVEFEYRLIKLKHHAAAEFEVRMADNPLASAYLPLTYYPPEDRPLIKAKAIRGVAKTVRDSARQATLISLIDISLPLNEIEAQRFDEIIQKDPTYQEVKMLQSIEEWGIEKGMEKGIEKGMEKGMEKGREETAINLLKMGMLTYEQIAQATNLPVPTVEALANGKR